MFYPVNIYLFKLAIETPRKDVKNVQSQLLAIKAPERRHWDESLPS